MNSPAQIGKYEIQSVLGRGANSVVYKAFDPGIARAVAIKAITKSRLAAGEIKHVMERFRHEAQAVGRLTHPRIVQIYEYGEDDEIAFIVMELVHGKTIAQHLKQEVHYEIPEVGAIVSQLLDGIGHAHRQGVVHRDVKPSNIMINRDGGIKIGDFGIARIESSNLTRLGDVLGTPHYMAPEQFLGAESDALADLYSIGVIAYELATGKRPYTGSAASIMQQVLNEQPPLPSHLNPRLTPLMDRVLSKALSKKREERFQDAREFAAAFRDAVEASTALLISGARTPQPDSAALLSAARLLTDGPARSTAAPMRALPSVRKDRAINLATSAGKARLLVIDDEQRILSALKALFRSHYHVFTTTDGDKALDFLRRYPMHAIICDQRLPSMPGVEVLRRARQISPNSVRILLTGYSDLAAIMGSVNDGEVYRFISKPWDNAELQIVVAEAVTIALALADTSVEAVQLPAQMDAGVLVIAGDEEIFRVTRELIGGLCPVAYAANTDAALAITRSREIAAVITDVAASDVELDGVLSRLKQENPRLVTIVATSASDSERVIALIHQAQIFRFLNKPVNVRLLNSHLRAALRCYLDFEQAPKRTHVSFLRQRILNGLRSLRRRWFGNDGR